jgi:uncharacterized lipoprotein
VIARLLADTASVPGTFLPAGRRRGSLLAALALLPVVLAGCFSAKNPDKDCDDVSEYQSSRSVPNIVVPEGLSTPTQSSTFVVPPAAGGDAPGASPELQPGAACLSRPPDFFRKDPAPAAK